HYSHARRAPWPTLYARRAREHQEQKICRGSESARSQLPMSGVPALLTRLSAASNAGGRGACRHAELDSQSFLLSGHHAPCARFARSMNAQLAVAPCSAQDATARKAVTCRPRAVQPSSRSPGESPRDTPARTAAECEARGTRRDWQDWAGDGCPSLVALRPCRHGSRAAHFREVRRRRPLAWIAAVLPGSIARETRHRCRISAHEAFAIVIDKLGRDIRFTILFMIVRVRPAMVLKILLRLFHAFVVAAALRIAREPAHGPAIPIRTRRWLDGDYRWRRTPQV